MLGFLKRRRRERLRRRPLPPEWAAIVRRNVPCTRRLTPDERDELHGHVLVFLNEKTFEGCGGLEMTDEIRVTVAAQACLLLLGRPTDYYPKMRTILVYPAGYVVPPSRFGPRPWDDAELEARLGESWYRGPVVLSWDDARQGAIDPRDGRNLVLHEFAHQLDSEDGWMDGTPPMADPGRREAWVRLLADEHRRLAADVRDERPTVLDAYGAAGEVEFFAVATEAFFERPVALRRRHPELYAHLKAMYRQDPAARAEDAPGPP